MASLDLITVIGAATFGGGILFGIILVVAAGIRAEGQLAWRRGTATLWDDPASRLAQGVRRINGVGLRTGELEARPTGAARTEQVTAED
jgi:hypothetical protein